jgi:catechol 2,3-dioxygenase-like lactoylglutathione lyase family enzyme
VTRSIDESKVFYCECLGFTEAPKVLESGSALSTMLGMENCEVYTCKLGIPNSNVRLELLEFVNPTSNDEVQTTLSSLGLTHFAITVENIQNTYNKALELGCKPISEPVKTDGGPSVFFMRDINNVFIEIVQE